MESRAYSVLEVRSVDEDARLIEGLASSPSTDRMGDIVDSLGAKFQLPMPLLWQHKHDSPVGHVEFAKPTKNGIPFRARIARIDEPGELKNLTDKAWQAVKAKLVRGVSIGFRALEYSFMESGGIHFKEWEWMELSLVTIPANADATITSVKRYAESPASAGNKSPVASGTVKISSGARGGTMFEPRIRELKATKATHEAQMQAVAQKAATEGRTMDDGEKEAFNTHLADVTAIQDEITMLESAAAMAAKATPVETAKSTEAVAKSRGTTTPTSVTVKQLPKGTAFTRYALAVAAGRGSHSDTLRYAERWRGSSPEVIEHIEKAAAGTSTDGTFAGPLVYASNLVSEFVELLRPMTVIGKLNGIRNVPFNVRIPRQTAGASVGWVQEGGVKNVVEQDFDTVTLAYHKMAAIIVLTDELVKFSQPNAEEIARRDLTEQIARFRDQQFLRQTVAAAAGNPASITNSVTPIPATGDDADALEADLFNALAPFDDTNVGDGNLYLVMQPKLARSIAMLRPDVGNGRLYPELSQSGGSLMGYPVITSNSVDNGFIVLVKADEILLADDGGVTLDASREATLDMNNGSSPAYSLWQKNAVAIRAEQFITWTKRRTTGAVSVISGAYYGAATVSES